MTREVPTWRQLFLADGIWIGAAAAVALVTGTVGDQLLRTPPLGWRYQSAVQRALTAPAVETAPQEINVVSLEDVVALLKRPNVITLDARPDVFFELGHLPGARNLSREKFSADFVALEPVLRTPGQTLLVYCSDASCEDSALVARALQERGFGPLLVFPGGFAEWESGGQTVESSP